MPSLLPSVSAHVRCIPRLWELQLLLVSLVRQLPPVVLPYVTALSSFRAQASRFDWFLSLSISPYMIVATLGLAAIGVAATGSSDLRVWLVLIASAAGWSSAWSP